MMIDRRTFMGVALMGLESLYAGLDAAVKAPALFCGHGSPMNLVSGNGYTRAMREISQKIKKPKAVIVISAHWVTNGVYVSTASTQNTIYDFYGFPDELYKIKYPAKGEPRLAKKVIALLSGYNAKGDNSRGLDHGAWGVLRYLFANADVPVFQISLDKNLSTEEHFEIGKKLGGLRDDGVMILGSGDIVHNLREIQRDPNAKAADWAVMFEREVKKAILSKDYDMLINYLELGEAARLSCPTPEHYLPLLYIAAATGGEELEFFYEGFEHSTISLSSFGDKF